MWILRRKLLFYALNISQIYPPAAQMPSSSTELLWSLNFWSLIQRHSHNQPHAASLRHREVTPSLNQSKKAIVGLLLNEPCTSACLHTNICQCMISENMQVRNSPSVHAFAPPFSVLAVALAQLFILLKCFWRFIFRKKSEKSLYYSVVRSWYLPNKMHLLRQVLREALTK